MRSFGADWSGGAQLFWRARSPLSAPGMQPIRSTLELPLAVPAAGVYDLTLHYTAAPDYGSFSLTVGETRTRIDGYAPAVMRRQTIVRGLSLRAGIQPLLFTVTGKDRASSNHFVGLDRIDLAPVAARDAASAGVPKDGVPAQGIGTLPDPVPSAGLIGFADIRFEPVIQVGGKASVSQTVQLSADQVTAVNVSVSGKSVKMCVTYLDFAVHNAGKGPTADAHRVVLRLPYAGSAGNFVYASLAKQAGWGVAYPVTVSFSAAQSVPKLAAGQRWVQTLSVPVGGRIDLELQVRREPKSAGNPLPTWQRVDSRVRHLPKTPC